MDIATQARINELLLEREELLLRIHRVETRAAELLGEPWPFERPPLPSDPKPRRKGSAAVRGKAGSVPLAVQATLPQPTPTDGEVSSQFTPYVPGPLRPLAGPSDSWLVVYEQYGQRQEERHRDPAALATLLACQCPTLRVLSVG